MSSSDSPKPVEASATFPEDPGKEIMKRLVLWTLDRLQPEKWGELTPAFAEYTRKLLNDSAITISQVRRGDFGEVFKAAAEEYPFDDEGRAPN